MDFIILKIYYFCLNYLKRHDIIPTKGYDKEFWEDNDFK